MKSIGSVVRHTHKKLVRVTAVPRTNPVFVFGNQKSGTTAIASLLAVTAGSSYSNDMLFHNGWKTLQPIYTGAVKFASLRKQLAHEFSCEVIKEPDLTLMMDDIRRQMPEARAVFVVRHPAANIRSILSRLGISGDKKALDKDDLATLDKLPLWRDVFAPRGNQLVFAESYIKTLAHRWNVMTSQYLRHMEWASLVRYEDFKKRKAEIIFELALSVGLRPKHGLDHKINEQFQRRGSQEAFDIFFSQENLALINSICKQNASHFNYYPEKSIET